MKKLCALVAVILSLLVAACQSTSPSSPLSAEASAPEGATKARYASAPPDRPGLGTKWGETRASRIGATSFDRANFNHPFAVGAVYYNDKAGIRAMAGTVAWERRPPILSDPAAVLVTIELRDESGRMLPV